MKQCVDIEAAASRSLELSHVGGLPNGKPDARWFSQRRDFVRRWLTVTLGDERNFRANLLDRLSADTFLCPGPLDVVSAFCVSPKFVVDICTRYETSEEEGLRLIKAIDLCDEAWAHVVKERLEYYLFKRMFSSGRETARLFTASQGELGRWAKNRVKGEVPWVTS